MKILLINPPASNGLKCVREGRCEQRLESYQYVMVPISIPSIAAVLIKEGFEAEIIDCIADDMSFEQLRKELRKVKPDFVIVNVATCSYYTDVKVADLCKELKIPCAAFGVHVTTLPERTLKEANFSQIIRGEPELTALELTKCLDKSGDLAKVLGISYKKGRKIAHNKDRPLVQDIDTLPFPARWLLDNEKYVAPLYHMPYTLIISSRGCPNSCTFCTASIYYGKKTRFRSAENIAAEVKHVKRKIGIKDFAMWSDTFTLNKQNLLEVCDGVKGLGVNWYCNSRVDTVDDQTLRAMAESGCRVITFGVESLDPVVLRNARKGIKVSQVRKAVELCRKHKILSQAHLIFGLPGETKETMTKTIKKIIEIGPDYAQFYGAIPFPGTELNEYAKKNKLLVTEDFSRYELNQAIISYPWLSDKEIQQGIRRAYRRFYLRPFYVAKKVVEFSPIQWPSIAKQTVSFAKEWVFGN